MAIFAGKLLAGETPTIFGDGNQTRDFVFVDDVVDAFARARYAGSGLLANVGTGTETTVNELFATMARLTGFTDAAVYAPARPGELARSASPGAGLRGAGLEATPHPGAGLDRPCLVQKARISSATPSRRFRGDVAPFEAQAPGPGS